MLLVILLDCRPDEYILCRSKDLPTTSKDFCRRRRRKKKIGAELGIELGSAIPQARQTTTAPAAQTTVERRKCYINFTLS